VPSDCNIAYLPAVAARIAVPAVAVLIGNTFEDALLIAYAAIVFTYRMRPGKLAAAGKVNVQVAVVLKTRDESAGTTV